MSASAGHLVLDSASLRYVLLQRTQYFSLTSLPFRVLPLRARAALEARLFAAKITKLFDEDMRAEYATLRAHLPAHVETILDVGCGIGGIDAIVAKERPRTRFIMLDKTKLDRHVYHDFETQASFYNSLVLTRSFLEKNGVAPERIFTLDVSDKVHAFEKNSVDVVLSLISWGFHYPIETYLEDAYIALRSGGVLILDIRASTGGERALRERFGNVESVLVREKYSRMKAIKE